MQGFTNYRNKHSNCSINIYIFIFYLLFFSFLYFLSCCPFPVPSLFFFLFLLSLFFSPHYFSSLRPFSSFFPFRPFSSFSSSFFLFPFGVKRKKKKEEGQGVKEEGTGKKLKNEGLKRAEKRTCVIGSFASNLAWPKAFSQKEEVEREKLNNKIIGKVITKSMEGKTRNILRQNFSLRLKKKKYSINNETRNSMSYLCASMNNHD